MTASAGEGLTVAIAKGRVLREAIPLLAAAGIRACEDPVRSRKLILDTEPAPGRAPVRLVVLRAQDVPTYLEYGAADAGIAGRDVLLEYPGDGWYEPLDLGISRCRLMVAAPVARGPRPPSRALRVATKFERVARRHFAERGVQAEIVKLYGSMELAPLAGLADRIVDLVATGETLRANGLEPVEHVADVSARLIVNKASMKMKAPVVKALIAALAAAAAAGGGG